MCAGNVYARNPKSQRLARSVYTTAETVLAAYADPQVGASPASCDIDTTRLLDGGGHALYVAAPLHEQARLRPLFTTLVQTVLATAYEKAAAKDRLDPPLLLVLDEAANIAPLRDLAQIASTAAGLGIQLVTVWQDRAQIVHRYGDAADTVVNNHRAKLLLSGITDSKTTTELANLIGETSVTRRSTTVDADGRTSATHGTQNQPLTSAAGLRQLRPFEGVLIYGHLPPSDQPSPVVPSWFSAPSIPSCVAGVHSRHRSLARRRTVGGYNVHCEGGDMDETPGITADDLPEIYRDGYLHAIEAAREEHDPASEWDAFREYLWVALVRVFGVDA